MNIKERLKQLQKENNQKNITIKDDYNSSQFFQKNEEVENIIVKAFNNEKNFILLCDKDCDKDIIINYFKNFISNIKHTEIIQNTNEDLEYSIASKIIMQNPKEKDIINLFKLSLNDFKTFVFTINSKNYENIINSLTTLISIELPNLKNQNIEHLIGSTEAIVAYISKDEDGIYYIKNIGEVNYKKNVLFLNTIYSKKETTIIENKIEEIKETKEIEFTTNEETNEIENISDTDEEIVQEEEIKEYTINNNNEIQTKNKTNKYKLLKEKFQKRKA